MERLKIKIHSKEHSEAVQKRLFELGYEWMGDRKDVMTLNDPCYLICNGNKIQYSVKAFEGCYAKETTLDDLYKKDFRVWVIHTPEGQFIMNEIEEAFKIKELTISFKTIEQLFKMQEPLTWK